MQNANLTNQDTNFLQAYLNHLSEEQRKAFVATYMYILNVGNGDAQFESQNFESLLEAEELSTYALNEELVTNVINFLKGKKNIRKYYKGLEKAAKSFVAASNKIENLDRDKRAQFRKSELAKYDAQIKALDQIKKQLEDFKKDSPILQKVDSFANNSYKIKLFLMGKKADVSLSKLKGYEDDIEKIKRDQTTLESDVKKANKEAEEKEKKRLEAKKAGNEATGPSDATKNATEKVKELKVVPENETPEQKTAREEKLKTAETAEKEAKEKDKADAKEAKEKEEKEGAGATAGTEEKGATAGTEEKGATAGTETEEKPEKTKADKIKTDTETVKAETDKTKADTEQIKAEADKVNAEADAKEAKNANVQKQIDVLKSKKNNLAQEIIKNPEKKETSEKGIQKFDTKIKELEDKLKENTTLSLSFFYDLESLNEEIKCLENSIGERL